MNLNLYKFLIPSDCKIEQLREGMGSFIWSGYLAVAVASSEEHAKELLTAELKSFGALTEWLRFAEVIVIPLDSPGFVAFCQTE